MTKETSETISLLRLPLAIMVVYIHAFEWHLPDFEALNFSSPTAFDVFDYVRYFFSNVFCQMAVPAFFFISGILFFAKAPEKFDWQFYKGQWSKRVFTLLIPYVIWNTIRLIHTYVKFRMGSLPAEDWQPTADGLWHLNFLWCINDHVSGADMFGNDTIGFSPAEPVLWFIRDLMMVVLAAPVLEFLLKKTKGYILILLGLVLLSGLTPGFYTPNNALFFFSAGAWISLADIDLAKVARKALPVIAPISVILMAYSFYTFELYKYSWHYYSTILFQIPLVAGIASVVAKRRTEKSSSGNTSVVNSSAEKPRLATIWKGVFDYASANTFFIYVAHAIIGLPVACRLTELAAQILGLTGNPYSLTLQYLVNPLIACAVCLAFLWVANRIAPRVMGVMTGQRSK